MRVKRDLWLIAIGVFRLTKAVLLVAAGFGVLRLLAPGVAATLRDWVAALPFAAEHAFLERSAALVTHLPRRRIDELAIAAFAYAALFTTEGTGLLLGKRWAEYLTIIATISFIPFEAVEVIRRVSVLRVAILVTNVLIVIYLIARRVRGRTV